MGEQLQVSSFKGMTIDTEKVFNTQSSRFKNTDADEDDDDDDFEPTPTWALPPDREIGLQHLM